MAVIPHSSVESFFHEVVTEALDRQGVEASEPTEWYLVSLLGEFAHSRITDDALALKLADQHAEASERVKNLKQVGDTSLYVTGFFADSLERKIVGVDYYMGIGATAYRELSRRLTNSTVAEVYDELSGGFPQFVDVLAEVRRNVDFGGDDVGRLYHEWLRTRADWVERRLAHLGLVVTPAGPSDDDGSVH
jgi:hypothetical protein